MLFLFFLPVFRFANAFFYFAPKINVSGDISQAKPDCIAFLIAITCLFGLFGDIIFYFLFVFQENFVTYLKRVEVDDRQVQIRSVAQ